MQPRSSLCGLQHWVCTWCRRRGSRGRRHGKNTPRTQDRQRPRRPRGPGGHLCGHAKGFGFQLGARVPRQSCRLVRYGAKDPETSRDVRPLMPMQRTHDLAGRAETSSPPRSKNLMLTHWNDTAPSVLGDGRGARARCYQSEACALRHFCVEGGSAETFLGSNRDERASKAVDAWAFVEKLDDASKDYYRSVVRFQSTSRPPRPRSDGARAVVTKRPEERRGDACAVLQKVGETLSDDGVIVECSGASPALCRRLRGCSARRATCPRS